MSSSNAKRQRHARDKGKPVIQQSNQQRSNSPRPKVYASPIRPLPSTPLSSQIPAKALPISVRLSEGVRQVSPTSVMTELLATLPEQSKTHTESESLPAVEPHPVVVTPTVIRVELPVNRHPQEGFSGEKSAITPMRHGGQRTPTPPSELTSMLESLREMFVRDRANGSRSDAARCGVCYLTFSQSELAFRDDDGLYLCNDCSHALGNQRLPMLRRQRR